MRKLGILIVAAFAVGVLLGVGVLGLLADGPLAKIPVESSAMAPQSQITTAAGARPPVTLANGTFSLGLPSVGPVNSSVGIQVDVPGNLSSVEVLVTPLQGASLHFRANGMGPCARDFGDVAAQGQVLSFRCEPAPAGKHMLRFSQDSGNFQFHVLVLGIPAGLS